MHSLRALPSRRMSLALFACSALVLAIGKPIATRAADDDVRLERVDVPADLLLTKPQGLEGDFDVAREAPGVEFAILPGQDRAAALWSAWGEALFASDGKYYVSLGDHGAPHGSAFVFSIDPAEGRIKLVVDYNAVVGVPANQYSPGKIHAGLVEADGWIYIIGYDGGMQGTTREQGFAGNWLLRYQPASGKVENLGIALPDLSVPTLGYCAANRSLYGLGIPGLAAGKTDMTFFRFDLKSAKPAFLGGPASEGARAMILVPDGRAYYGHRDAQSGRGVLVRYDPKTNTATKLDLAIPGSGMLRAASRVDAGGTAYCFSQDGTMFALNTRNDDVRGERIEELTKSFVAEPRYTTTCRLDPSGRWLYYLPGAHGESDKIGTPLVQFDVRTRRRKVLAFLNAAVRQKLAYNLGGTYGIDLNRDGSELLICFNGAPLGSRHADFGQCAVVRIKIPQSERQFR